MLKSQKPHIGLVGNRNAGKSSLINLITNQEISIVSDTPGTTTDPVKVHMEVPGLGPCVFIDTAGIDDEGELGGQRVRSTIHALNSCDLCLVVLDEKGMTSAHEKLIGEIEKNKTPWAVLWNKADIFLPETKELELIKDKYKKPILCTSAKTDLYKEKIVDLIRKSLPSKAKKPSIVGDLIKEGDFVVLVTPIDQEAPKGRLILPQVQTIRDILDHNAMAIVLKERELDIFFKNSNITPSLVITDSQAFLKTVASCPPGVPVTSFSILFSRQKGPFLKLVEGTRKIDELQDGNKVLILESCTHHTAGDDIGRVKIPRWISNYTGKNLHFDVKAGNDHLPENIDGYKLVIQCGGCMLSETEFNNRLRSFILNDIPVTNYGMCIAYSLGIFEQALKPFSIPGIGHSYL